MKVEIKKERNIHPLEIAKQINLPDPFHTITTGHQMAPVVEQQFAELAARG